MSRRAQREGNKGSKLLEQFGRDLTELASEGKLDPVVRRENVIEELMQILADKKNPLLIGQPGVGKTTMVKGVAQCITSGEAPEPLKNQQIYMLDVRALVASSNYRGEFEERLKEVMNEVTKRRKTILFIDDFHKLVDPSAAGLATDAGSILNLALASAEVQAIATTTLDEYRRYTSGTQRLSIGSTRSWSTLPHVTNACRSSGAYATATRHTTGSASPTTR